jgi:hypothetical protein
MAPVRTSRWLAPLAVLLLALGCGGQDRSAAKAPAEPAEEPAAETTAPPAAEPESPAAAPAPSGPVVARTVTPDGEVFEAEYGKADQLPTDFPDDVPLYGNARPLSSMAAPDRGTVVNLRSSDSAAEMFAWYQQQYAAQGWEIEHAKQEHARSTLVARKGNRVSSIVILGVPGATQALLTVSEDR